MTCWTCSYQQLGGRNLLGFCLWFTTHRGETAKAIPPHVVDAGCTKWTERKRS